MEFGKNKIQKTFQEGAKFTSPEEELDFLRSEVARKEKELSMETGYKAPKTESYYDDTRERIARALVREYGEQKTENVLSEEYKMDDAEKEKIILNLSPERHDSTIEELLGVLQEKGLKNTLELVRSMNNPHIADDFHRFLIQYIQYSPESVRIRKGHKLFKALHMKLYQVSLPELSEEEQPGALKELLSAMEQFYAGMLSISDGKEAVPQKNYFTLEIALSSVDEEVVFYVSVPREKSDLFEKHINAIFPNARVENSDDDYNIFNEDGFASASLAESGVNPLLPIKSYEDFDNDPVNVILGAFAKLKKQGEGAAIQFVVMPAGDRFVKKYGDALQRIREGVSLKDVLEPESFAGGFAKAVGELVLGSSDKKKNDKPVDELAISEITKKISSTIVNTNIRIITSAQTELRSREIIVDLQSAFNQFSNTSGNSIKFRDIKSRKLAQFFQKFSYRVFSDEEAFPLNLKELSTLYHFPVRKTTSHQLKHVKMRSAPAPMNMEEGGVLLGVNDYRGLSTNVYLGKEDRLRHFYVIGQTGTGKTHLLKSMIAQDVKNGDGVCMIDPHGTDIQDILAQIPPERMDDVIYFDPADASYPMALNMLEYDTNNPQQKAFVVNEMLSIFNKLFDMQATGGPMFEQYFRNATMLVIEDPQTGNTLLDVSRVLSDAKFRELKLSRCNNPIVVQFWREVAAKAGGEAALANIVPYITSKFDVFLADEVMRPIIAQEKSSFDFRKIMDEKKILLVNLSKGRLGDINSNLIGLILVGKILMAALSRVDIVGTHRPSDFYLYIDEFQNITTSSISSILSEARKYGLSLNIAHQYISQLDEQIKNSVFGNVGSMAVFRVGSEDAQFLEKQFEPIFDAKDIMSLDNRNAYLKLLVNGQPEKPFNIKTLALPDGNPELARQIKELSHRKYSRPREEVEAEIMKKYQ